MKNILKRSPHIHTIVYVIVILIIGVSLFEIDLKNTSVSLKKAHAAGQPQNMDMSEEAYFWGVPCDVQSPSSSNKNQIINPYLDPEMAKLWGIDIHIADK